MPPPLPSSPPERRKRWLLWLLISIGIRLIASTSTSFALRANTAKAIADVKALEITVLQYQSFTNGLPAPARELSRRPDNASSFWRKVFEEGGLKDAWGQPYQYRNPGRHNPDSYDIYSRGPDMKEDTEDDIGNWEN